MESDLFGRIRRLISYGGISTMTDLFFWTLTSSLPISFQDY